MGQLYIIGTPIGNLEDITLRALRVLGEVDLVYCEDTRRTIKLLNHYKIQKTLRSCPYFKERSRAQEIVRELDQGKKIAFASDAGVPAVSDPGSILVAEARAAGHCVEVIGGVSALTYFLAGLGEDLEVFRFVGFLPARSQQRKVFLGTVVEPTIFYEGPHRLEATLRLWGEQEPGRKIALGKELSKISERFFVGSIEEVISEIKSYKGEWVGCLWPKVSEAK